MRLGVRVGAIGVGRSSFTGFLVNPVTVATLAQLLSVRRVALTPNAQAEGLRPSAATALPRVRFELSVAKLGGGDVEVVRQTSHT